MSACDIAGVTAAGLGLGGSAILHGMEIQNVVPFPTSLSHYIVPPISSTAAEAAMAEATPTSA